MKRLKFCDTLYASDSLFVSLIGLPAYKRADAFSTKSRPRPRGGKERTKKNRSPRFLGIHLSVSLVLCLTLCCRTGFFVSFSFPFPFVPRFRLPFFFFPPSPSFPPRVATKSKRRYVHFHRRAMYSSQCTQTVPHPEHPVYAGLACYSPIFEIGEKPKRPVCVLDRVPCTRSSSLTRNVPAVYTVHVTPCLHGEKCSVIFFFTLNHRQTNLSFSKHCDGSRKFITLFKVRTSYAKHYVYIYLYVYPYV